MSPCQIEILSAKGCLLLYCSAAVGIPLRSMIPFSSASTVRNSSCTLTTSSAILPGMRMFIRERSAVLFSI